MINQREILQISNLSAAPQRRLRTLLCTARSGGGELKAIFREVAATLPPPSPEEDKAMNFCSQSGTRLILFGSSEYPASLYRLADPPLVLFVRGARGAFENMQHPVAIVGSRRADRDGINDTKQIVSSLSQYGVTFVSGLAFGIDAATHWAALRFQEGSICPTVAILPCGLDTIYPKAHEKLANAILDGGGALVSEFFPGTQIQRHHFLQRNRIVAALSNVVIIVQAGQRSGARATATVAADLGIEVFAIPGPIGNWLYAGNHDLLREGASLLTDIPSLAHDLGLLPSSPRDVEPVHEQVCELLRERGALSLTNLQNELACFDLSEILLELESSGSLVCLPGGYYRVN